ncbi:tetratricopeptide [Colletotrichum navitas]|uniref:Tetratricopeptide n=1 Tax=Colletotrichum navitas TaxID=681940 RepID=A0AAD8PKT9_9PEZI|nr:tetratricopeptide [Colletotrichum navitas]KAK1566219.1 tetratricopeptide [Colletotrichum navitas]
MKRCGYSGAGSIWKAVSWGNIKQGDYKKALSLSAEEPDSNPKKQKLYTRMAKCHLLSLSLDDAEKSMASLPDDSSAQAMRATLKDMHKISSIQDSPEYYAVGHDTAYPLWDEPLWHAGRPRGDVSFLLCGSGDARHLFLTMVFLGLSGPSQGENRLSNKAHFTILDINATASARTLVIFDMAIRYVFMRCAKMPRIEDELTVMSYIYSSAAVPAFVAEKLEEHIESVIAELEGDGDALEITKEFRGLGVLSSGDIFIGRREPALRPLLDAFRSRAQGAKHILEGYIDSHWKTNRTLLDMDYETRRYDELETGVPPRKSISSIELDPAQLVQSVYNPARLEPEDGHVLESLEGFFETLATATMTLLRRVQIEAIAGEMADILERIRYDGLGYCSQKPLKVGAIDATHFPRQYNRIHMRNIPDYVGGPLAALLYGGPLLREDRPSNLRFNNLLNPPMLERHDQFLTEYILVYDAKQVADHFGLVKEQETGEAILNPIAKMIGNQFMTENHFIRARSGAMETQRSRLTTRPALEKWQHSYLLKICVPYRRPLWSDSPVHPPLNSTAFLRIVLRLHEVGYPAHWLADVLASICEGSITTTARSARKLVPHPNDLKTSYPHRKISLGPWKAELTTLFSLWRRLLPFGTVTPLSALAYPVEVLECGISFPNFVEKFTRAPYVNVVFTNMTMVGSRKLDLPDHLQDDEEGDESDYAKRLREESVHIITAFKYVTDTRMATCWLRYYCDCNAGIAIPGIFRELGDSEMIGCRMRLLCCLFFGIISGERPIEHALVNRKICSLLIILEWFVVGPNTLHRYLHTYSKTH